MASLPKWLSVGLQTKWLWFRVHLQSLKLQILRLSREGIPWHSGNYRVWIHSETRTWHDKNIQSNALYRYVLTTQISHLTSLAKWLSVRLRTKGLWVRVQLQFRATWTSDSAPVLSKEFFDSQATIECGFNLIRVRDIIRTYSQMNRTDKYSQHSSIIWLVGLNDWVFVYELSGHRFESSCSNLNFRFRTCFGQGVLWHSGNYRVWIHSETRTWHDKDIQSLFNV